MSNWLQHLSKLLWSTTPQLAGAIDEKGNLTKPLGENMAELPIPPTLSKVRQLVIICLPVYYENVFLIDFFKNTQCKY